MKILILGASGLIGSIIHKFYQKQNQYKIIAQVSNSNKQKHSCYLKVDLEKNLDKVVNLINNESFHYIFNCLYEKTDNGIYSNSLAKRIVKLLNYEITAKTVWIEMSSISVLFQNKTLYAKKKIQFEQILKRKYFSNLQNLKILRISNFTNEYFLNKFSFFSIYNNIFIPSFPNNQIFITSEKLIHKFLKHQLNSKKTEINLFKCLLLIDFGKKYFVNKNIIFLKLNITIFYKISYFLNRYYKDKLTNFINLFYS